MSLSCIPDLIFGHGFVNNDSIEQMVDTRGVTKRHRDLGSRRQNNEVGKHCIAIPYTILGRKRYAR